MMLGDSTYEGALVSYEGIAPNKHSVCVALLCCVSGIALREAMVSIQTLLRAVHSSRIFHIQ